MGKQMNTKFLAVIYITVLSLSTIFSYITPATETASAKEQVIPEDAIRLRILANSNSETDQAVKRQIRDEVKANMDGWVGGISSGEEAHDVIKDHIDEVKQIAETEMEKSGLDQSVDVKLGKADFPTKLYGDYLYPAGQYEALIITLGAAEGNNWWCVLYPPLCFLDFNSGTAVDEKAADSAAASQNTTTTGKVSEGKSLEAKATTQKDASAKKDKVKTEFATVKLVKKIIH